MMPCATPSERTVVARQIEGGRDACGRERIGGAGKVGHGGAPYRGSGWTTILSGMTGLPGAGRVRMPCAHWLRDR
jgi:hypothetical protein